MSVRTDFRQRCLNNAKKARDAKQAGAMVPTEGTQTHVGASAANSTIDRARLVQVNPGAIMAEHLHLPQERKPGLAELLINLVKHFWDNPMSFVSCVILLWGLMTYIGADMHMDLEGVKLADLQAQWDECKSDIYLPGTEKLNGPYISPRPLRYGECVQINNTLKQKVVTHQWKYSLHAILFGQLNSTKAEMDKAAQGFAYAKGAGVVLDTVAKHHTKTPAKENP